MSDLKHKHICPECNGKKGYKKAEIYCWEEPQKYEWVVCHVCRGVGEIDNLKLAIYKAREMNK